MSKKILSIILSVMLVFAIGAFSVAAEAGVYYEPQPYQPSAAAAEVGFYRYFFLLPDDWCNEFTEEAGIYWWSGTDACGALDGTGGDVKWPGYKIYKYGDTTANVWYCDVPKDVPTIIFNNALDGGDEAWDNFDADRYVKAVQTVDIGTEYYDVGESDEYPDGTENFNNMIYVVDPEKTAENPVNGKLTYGGEWYYYHGDGLYDTQANPVYGGADGEAPHVSEGQEEATLPPTAAPVETTAATVPQAATGATSKVSSADEAQPTTVAGNGTIATGTMSFVVIALVVAAGIAGFVIVLRKRELEK